MKELIKKIGIFTLNTVATLFNAYAFFEIGLRKGYLGGYRIRRILAKEANRYPKPTIRRIEKAGLVFNLDISNYNDWRVYYGIFDNSSAHLFSLVQPHYTILDIGANLGYYTLNFAKKASQGSVLAFEPHPKNLKKLKQNIELNSWSNILVFDIALGDVAQKAGLEIGEPNNLGTSRIQKDMVNKNISIISLDEFLDKKDILDRVDLIKMDIEGFEMKAIIGAKETILKYQPILFIELCDKHLRHFGSSATVLLAYLSKLGYTQIVDASTQKALNKTELLNNQFDIICYPSVN